jgi:hypothetical protein
LSREVPWVAFTPVGDEPVQCDTQHLAEDPVVVLAPSCCQLSAVVSLVGGHQYMWDTVGLFVVTTTVKHITLFYYSLEVVQ